MEFRFRAYTLPTHTHTHIYIATHAIISRAPSDDNEKRNCNDNISPARCIKIRKMVISRQCNKKILKKHAHYNARRRFSFFDDKYCAIFIFSPFFLLKNFNIAVTRSVYKGERRCALDENLIEKKNESEVWAYDVVIRRGVSKS